MLELEIALELDELPELALDIELIDEELDDDEHAGTNPVLHIENADEESSINHATKLTPYPVGGQTVVLKSVEVE